MKLTKDQKKTIKELLREYVIARDGEKCLRCGKTEQLQMSHIYSVGAHKKLEYDESNLKLLCVRCHLYWWHRNPIEANAWLLTVIPEKRLKQLKLRAQSNAKGPNDYNALKLYLEQLIKNT